MMTIFQFWYHKFLDLSKTMSSGMLQGLLFNYSVAFENEADVEQF